jgi:hypothetical protein
MSSVACDAHGERAWKGTLVCAREDGGCGRVYQTKDEAAPFFAPQHCTCGEQLMPRRDVPFPEDKFTARPICGSCFDEQAKQALQ